MQVFVFRGRLVRSVWNQPHWREDAGQESTRAIGQGLIPGKASTESARALALRSASRDLQRKAELSPQEPKPTSVFAVFTAPFGSARGKPLKSYPDTSLGEPRR